MADKEVELEPIDLTRCQAERKVGSFMSFGNPKLTRCQHISTWLAIDVKDGSFNGAMALCEVCKKVCEIRMPGVNFQKIKPSRKN